MRALRVVTVVLLVASVGVATVAARPIVDPPGADPTARVGIFFYPWYGTQIRDGSFQHWSQRGNLPPLSIASSYFPARGIYSSTDPNVLRLQMADIALARIGVVIVSWWGAGSPEDERLPGVVAAARSVGLVVAVHIEPYAGRTPQSVADDVARLHELGISDFYVYGSASDPDADWAAVNHSLSGVRLFANTPFATKAAAGGFAGIYTYDVYIYNGFGFPRMCAAARRLHLVCAPSVGPGYDARAEGDPRMRPRNDGETYDGMWRSALRAHADMVTITSYNEWHEGTQIEPAADAGMQYESYDGAWGLYGKAAQRAYLDRTAYWVGQYSTRLAQLWGRSRPGR